MQTKEESKSLYWIERGQENERMRVRVNEEERDAEGKFIQRKESDLERNPNYRIHIK